MDAAVAALTPLTTEAREQESKARLSIGSYLRGLARPGRLGFVLRRGRQIFQSGGLRALRDKLREKLWLGSGPPSPRQYARWIRAYERPAVAPETGPSFSLVSSAPLAPQSYRHWEQVESFAGATGTYLAVVGPGDELAPDALARFARALIENPAIDIIYSDEDGLEGSRRVEPRFKPRWNPDLALASGFPAGLMLVRRTLAVAMGGLGSGELDLLLRCLPENPVIAHLPRVLYHRRTPLTFDVQALHAHLPQAEILAGPLPGTARIRYRLPTPPPLVSIVIPTRDGGAVLERCLTSLRAHTSYPRFEIIVVDNQSRDPVTLSLLARERVLHFDAPFNYSAINNLAARSATGELLCFLNDDTEVIEPGWLEELVSQALRPSVGAVGAKLLYPDGRIQHAGVGLGLLGLAGHFHKGLDAGAPGYMGRAQLVQEVSAVTGACLMVRKESFERVGGFDEIHLPVSFNDVDLCLRLRESGLRCIFTPHAVLIHHESYSRGADDTAEKLARVEREAMFLRSRWAALIADDPAYSPNLSLWTENFGLSWPPRTP